MLDEEAASDLQLKEQFGDKWSRTPSAKLTESIRKDGEKYNSIISNAVHADTVVKEKYNTNKWVDRVHLQAMLSLLYCRCVKAKDVVCYSREKFGIEIVLP